MASGTTPKAENHQEGEEPFPDFLSTLKQVSTGVRSETCLSLSCKVGSHAPRSYVTEGLPCTRGQIIIKDRRFKLERKSKHQKRGYTVEKEDLMPMPFDVPLIFGLMVGRMALCCNV
jgi:hypothetical protein